MRVEGAQHPVDRGVDELPVFHLAAVAVVGQLEKLGVEPQLALGFAGHGEEPLADEAAEKHRGSEKDDRGVAPRSGHGPRIPAFGMRAKSIP